MTAERARELIISSIDYVAYKETDHSLYDSDKNRLFGSEHYNSGRPVHEPSPWAQDDFEGKMASLLAIAIVLNRSIPKFAEAARLIDSEDSILGRVVRGARDPKTFPEI